MLNHFAIKAFCTLRNNNWIQLLFGKVQNDFIAKWLSKRRIYLKKIELKKMFVNSLSQVYTLAKPPHRLQLTSINLSSNNNIMSSGTLTRGFDKSAAAFAVLFSSTSSLSSLDLSRNGIRGDAASSIARSLRSNQNVKTLKLSWNSFGALFFILCFCHT